jgi:hypothetical protein
MLTLMGVYPDSLVGASGRCIKFHLPNGNSFASMRLHLVYVEYFDYWWLADLRSIQVINESQETFSSNKLPMMSTVVATFEMMMTNLETMQDNPEFSALSPGLEKAHALMDKYWNKTDLLDAYIICMGM